MANYQTDCPDCGYNPALNGGMGAVLLCPTHAAAPRMLALLKSLSQGHWHTLQCEHTHPNGHDHAELSAILRDVEGPETGSEYAKRIKERDDAHDQRWTSGDVEGETA